MQKFLHSNDTVYRLLRTVVQGIIGVLVANLDLVISRFTFDPTFKPMIAALVMAILSPIMAEMGKENDDSQDYYIVKGKEEEDGENHSCKAE